MRVLNVLTVPLLMIPMSMAGQSGAPASSAAPPHAATRALTAGELSGSASRLDRGLVSGLAGKLRVEAHQSFSVTTAAGSLWIEPVLYEANNPETGNTSPRCGVFFLNDKDKAVFVPTLGSGWTNVETCTALEGVGFLDSSSGMPRILLLYDASSPNFSTREPIVLDWNAGAHAYQGNKELSTALTHKGGNASIAGMKRRIKELGDAAR